MLPDTTVLNTKTVAEILRMGYTRIPVYSGDRYYVFLYNWNISAFFSFLKISTILKITFVKNFCLWICFWTIRIFAIRELFYFFSFFVFFFQ